MQFCTVSSCEDRAGNRISGSMDGHLRAYSSSDGKVLWDFDTIKDYTAVSGIRVEGGSLNHGDPTVLDGMLFVNSAYANVMPGNVLLAFSVNGD